MVHPFNDGMDLGSLAHMVIFTQVDEAVEGISDERVYLVDAGFGGLDIVQPSPLGRSHSYRSASSSRSTGGAF
jgi:hypothetical protein